MTGDRSAETITLPREHAQAVLRVLTVCAAVTKLIARRANALYAHDGNLWTVLEVSNHAKGAAQMLRKDLKR